MKKLILMIVVLAALPVAAVLAANGKAKIVTQNQLPASCISRIVVTDIDGRLRTVPKQGFELDAGPHTIQGRAIVSMANCPTANAKKAYPVPALEADFEAGKTYYVGLDHSSRNQADWRLVIWKTE